MTGAKTKGLIYHTKKCGFLSSKEVGNKEGFLEHLGTHINFFFKDLC